MTVEDMRQGVSRIRNHVIARVFRELNLIEQWGSGVRRMFKEARNKAFPSCRLSTSQCGCGLLCHWQNRFLPRALMVRHCPQHKIS